MSAPYYGDFPASHTAVCMPFDSFAASTGAPSATSNFAAGDVLIYKDGGTTQRASSAGITVSTSFDSQTGLQMVVIDLSDNTDAGFYAAGHEYSVAVADVTIDAQTVRFWLGSFSIERAGAALALVKSGTYGLAALKTLIDTIDDFVDTEVAAIKAKTDNLPSDPADASDIAASFASIASTLSTIAAYIDTEVAAIKAKTDNLPASPAATGDAMTLTGGERTAIAAAAGVRVITEGYASDGSAPTLDQALCMIFSAAAQFDIAGTTLTTRKLDGTTQAMVFTLDDAVNPTSRVRTL